MDSWIDYFLKVSAFQGIFFFFFWVFLSKKTHHQWNRRILLTALMVSAFAPYIQLPSFTDSVVTFDSISYEVSALNADIEVASHSGEIEEPKAIDTGLIMTATYLIIASAMAIRLGIHLVFLLQVKAKSKLVSISYYRLYQTALEYPFSFLRYIFLPKTLFDKKEYDQVLIHEQEHVKQKHSIDRLIIDFMIALLWFNPFIYLYRKALIEIHEFQADDAVLDCYQDRIAYQEVLYRQLSTCTSGGLMSHFNFSITKKRIVMINKQKSKKYWMHIAAVPVLLLMIVAFSGKIEPELTDSLEARIPIHEEINKKEFSGEKGTRIDNNEKPIVVQDPEYRPSILPIVGLDKIKVTSSYGMRRDPFTQEMKMHKGMDIRASIGTKVVATADGVIHGAGFHKGYGNYVLIDHGGEYLTRYGQLDSYMLERGDEVKKGQQIGLTGNSGRSTAPHLHYEVVKVGEGHMDPALFIENYDFPEGVKTGLNTGKMSDTKLAKLIYKQEHKKAEKALLDKKKDLDKIEKQLAKEEKVYLKVEEKAVSKSSKAKLKVSEF